MKRTALAAVPLVALTLLFSAELSACSRDGASPSELSAAPGGELRLATSEPRTLDPAGQVVSSGLGILRQLYRGLLWFDENLNLVPMVAREVPSQKNGGISPDGLVYRFRLRAGMKWSDGKLVTAGDFEYGLKHLLQPGSSGNELWYDIKGAERFGTCQACVPEDVTRLRDEVGVKATDDATLIVTLRAPRAGFLHLLTLVPPLRADLIDRFGERWTEPGNMVSMGPFVLKEWVSGDHLVLAPNPHWTLSEVRLERVVVKFILTPQARLRAYQSGQLDMIEIFPDLVTPAARQSLMDQTTNLPSLTSNAIFFNTTQPPFDNKLVRQAFSLAVDRQALTGFWLQSSDVTYTWLPPAMRGFDAAIGQKWQFDPERARKLLAEAGYPEGRGLPPITYVYPRGGTNPSQTIPYFLEAQWQSNLNVAIKVEAKELQQVRALFTQNQVQVVFNDWSGLVPDASAMLAPVWTCERYEGGNCRRYSSANTSRYANPEFDRLLQQAAKELDEKRRVKLYQQAERLLLEDAPAVFIGPHRHSVLVKPYVGGAVHTAMDNLPAELLLDRVYIKANSSPR